MGVRYGVESAEVVLKHFVGWRRTLARLIVRTHGGFRVGPFYIVQLAHVLLEIEIPTESFLTDL